MTFEIEEEDRQMILLAIAELAADRPGWEETLRRLAGELRGGEMFDKFRALRVQRRERHHR